MADFLFGDLYQMNQASGQFFNPRGKFIGAYVQDSWKATPRLTLDYGVRYEPFKPWHELQGRMGSFFPTLWASNTHSTEYPLAPAGMQFAGDPGFNPNGVASAYNHFMPRLGFAYDAFGNGKTAFAAAAAYSSTAASIAPCSTSTPTWRRSLPPSLCNPVPPATK